MKAELKFYQECPFCHKDMRDHDIRSFKVERDNELQKIELNRNVPREYFEKWLVEQKMKYTDLINTMHESVAFRVKVGYDTHAALTNINHWYDLIDIYDNELSPDEQEYYFETKRLKDIYNHFKTYFKNETEQDWLRRFLKTTNIKYNSIITTKEGRIVLLSILDKIHDIPHDRIDYNKFVFERFKIKAWSKTCSDYRDKDPFTIAKHAFESLYENKAPKTDVKK